MKTNNVLTAKCSHAEKRKSPSDRYSDKSNDSTCAVFYLNGAALMTSRCLSRKLTFFSIAGLDAAQWIKTMASSWHGNRSQVRWHVSVARAQILTLALKQLFYFETHID